MDNNTTKGGGNIPVKKLLRVDNPETRLDLIRSVLETEKADDARFFDLRGKTPIGDYMVIISGRSSTHVIALAEKIMEKCKSNDINNIKTEGSAHGDWVIVDIGDVIVHIFRPEVRNFYDLDKLWQECHLATE